MLIALLIVLSVLLVVAVIGICGLAVMIQSHRQDEKMLQDVAELVSQAATSLIEASDRTNNTNGVLIQQQNTIINILKSYEDKADGGPGDKLKKSLLH